MDTDEKERELRPVPSASWDAGGRGVAWTMLVPSLQVDGAQQERLPLCWNDRSITECPEGQWGSLRIEEMSHYTGLLIWNSTSETAATYTVLTDTSLLHSTKMQIHLPAPPHPGICASVSSPVIGMTRNIFFSQHASED
jgi:hypothetical protein